MCSVKYAQDKITKIETSQSQLWPYMHLRYCSVHKSSWCSQIFLFCYLIHQFAYNCWLVHWIFGIGPVISSFLSIVGSASLDLQFVYFAAISIFEQAISAHNTNGPINLKWLSGWRRQRSFASYAN